MRIVFMGTSEFAVPTMLEIVKGGHTLVAAYARAPAAGGRRGLESQEDAGSRRGGFNWNSCLHANNFARRPSGERVL